MRSKNNPTYFDTHVLPAVEFLTSPTTQIGLIVLVVLLGLALAHVERPLVHYPLGWLFGAAIAVTALSFALSFLGFTCGATL